MRRASPPILPPLRRRRLLLARPLLMLPLLLLAACDDDDDRDGALSAENGAVPAIVGTVTLASGAPAAAAHVNLEYRLIDGEMPDRVASGSATLAAATDSLLPNYPNPFIVLTTFRFTSSVEQAVRIDVRDRDGAVVRTLMEEIVTTGEHSTEWNGRDASGAMVPNGFYSARAEFLSTGSTRAVDSVFLHTADPDRLVHVALTVTDDRGRYEIPIAGLPIGETVELRDFSGQPTGSYPIDNRVVVHAGTESGHTAAKLVFLGSLSSVVIADIELP